MSNENNEIAKEYLKLFFADIEQLSEFVATYKNVLVEVKSKLDASDIEKSVTKLDSEEKRRLWFQAQSVRYHVTRINQKVEALAIKVNEFKQIDFPKLTLLLDKIREATLPEFKDVEAYSKEMNKLFVTGIAAPFLEGAGPGYSSLIGNQYSGDGKTQ